MNIPQENWAKAMSFEIDFYDRSNRKTRVDTELNWEWYYSMMTLKRRVGLYLKPILSVLYKKKYQTLDFKKYWFTNNAKNLWAVRSSFHDELSRKQFDSFLVSSICGFERFYYSRLHFDDMITVEKERPFTENLPKEYMGLPLNEYDVKLEGSVTPEITIISAQEEIDVTNNYKRYFTHREGVTFVPAKDDVVFDCGSCIGEISMVFAAYVGKTGTVHLFDPIPLHNKYSKLQIERNPSLAGVFVINELGVSDVSKTLVGTITDVDTISPGGCRIDSFDSVSIDDYVKKNNITRLDYIKMDIEGAELDALQGAAETLKRFKPKLAISAYHKASHLWEVPQLIQKIEPSYKVYFEQHLPFECDALVYASV